MELYRAIVKMDQEGGADKIQVFSVTNRFFELKLLNS